MSEYIYKIQLIRPEVLSEGPTEEEAKILKDHAEYVDQLTQESKALLAGRTQNIDATAFGIVILSVESEEEAKHLMDNDPAVKYGVMNAELYPYKIAFLSSDVDKHVYD